MLTLLAAALAEDIRHLQEMLWTQQQTVLVMFDTFEAIESNPLAVLRTSQTFPDSYGLSRMKVLRPDAMH